MGRGKTIETLRKAKNVAVAVKARPRRASARQAATAAKRTMSRFRFTHTKKKRGRIVTPPTAQEPIAPPGVAVLPGDSIGDATLEASTPRTSNVGSGDGRTVMCAAAPVQADNNSDMDWLDFAHPEMQHMAHALATGAPHESDEPAEALDPLDVHFANFWNATDETAITLATVPDAHSNRERIYTSAHVEPSAMSRRHDKQPHALRATMEVSVAYGFHLARVYGVASCNLELLRESAQTVRGMNEEERFLMLKYVAESKLWSDGLGPDPNGMQ